MFPSNYFASLFEAQIRMTWFTSHANSGYLYIHCYGQYLLLCQYSFCRCDLQMSTVDL